MDQQWGRERLEEGGDERGRAGQGRPWGWEGTRDRHRLSTPGNLFPQGGPGVGAAFKFGLLT